MKAKISLLKLRHTFLAVLTERKQKSEIHTIKPSVIDHIFDLKIGSERRSMKVSSSCANVSAKINQTSVAA